MRISTHTTVALTLSLLNPACDDMTDLEAEAGADDIADEDEDEEDGEGIFGAGARPRCSPPPCTDPPIGNTNWVGHHPLDTVPHEAWNVPIELASGNYMRFLGASCAGISNLYKFTATAHGELVFYKSSTGGNTPSNLIRGEAVEGCQFYAQFAASTSFSNPQSVVIRIQDAVEFNSARLGVKNYKYMMVVPNLNTDLPVFHEYYHPTCYDNADAQGNYYLQIRPGLALNRNDWRFMGDATKQSWVCTSGAFGHFGLRKVDPADISDPVLGTTEGRAWGLYHHGASHTFVGNPIRIHHPTIPGYDTAPNSCDPLTKDWYREALWGGGQLMCRGSNATAWSDKINRNAYLKGFDWDDDTSVSSVSVCSGSPTHDFETYARCYMNGSLRVCPINNEC